MRLQEIAKKLNVSTSTVSRALNPATEALISEEVRQKIQSYAEKIHYVPNRTAQNLALGRSNTIGVILYSAFGSLFFSDYLSKVLDGLCAGLGEKPRYSSKLVLLPRGRSLSEADQHVVGTGTDGILLSTICDFTEDRMRDLAETVERRWRRPVVALNLPASSKSRISTVSFSNEEAAYLAVTHLIQRGHKRIGLILSHSQSRDEDERVTGYESALKDHRLARGPEMRSFANFTTPSAYQATLELFQRKGSEKITAIFCIDDEMAIGAIRAIRALGKRCPEDVAVMGFDGIEAGEFLETRLSTVAQPFFELSKRGTRLLIDLIEGRCKGPVHETVKAPLIVRDSA